MSLTEASPQPKTREAQQVQPPQPKQRRLSRKVLAGAIALGVCIGAASGYVASQPSAQDPLERGRAADSARLQAQADAYLAQQERYRGMSADAVASRSQSGSGTESPYSGMSPDAAEQWSQAESSTDRIHATTFNAQVEQLERQAQLEGQARTYGGD